MTNNYIPIGSTVSFLSLNGPLYAVSDYFVPLTGNSVTLVNSYSEINPAGTLSALTVVLPLSPQNGQICSFVSSQIVTTLTLTGTVVGTGPTALAVGTVYRYRYNSTTSSWWPC